MTWNLIEALTGFWTGDDYFINGRKENVISTKTHYPHPAGRMVPFEVEVERALILIRHPMDAIPSYHNYHYETDNNLPLHSIRAPVEEWIPWRELHFENELNMWKESIIYWMESYPPKNRMVMFYENLVEEHTGPLETLRLSRFLGRTAGVKTVEKERAECVWQAIVKYKEQRIEQTRRLEESSVYISRPQNEQEYVVVNASLPLLQTTLGNPPNPFVPTEEMRSSPSDAKVAATSAKEGVFSLFEQQELETSTLKQMQPNEEQFSVSSPMTIDGMDNTSSVHEVFVPSENEGASLSSGQQEFLASTMEQMQPNGEQFLVSSPMIVDGLDSTPPGAEVFVPSENEGASLPSEQQEYVASNQEQMQLDREQSLVYPLAFVDGLDSAPPGAEVFVPNENDGASLPSEQPELSASTQEQIEPNGEQFSFISSTHVDGVDGTSPVNEMVVINENEGKVSLSEQEEPDFSLSVQMQQPVPDAEVLVLGRDESKVSFPEQQDPEPSTLEQIQQLDGKQLEVYPSPVVKASAGIYRPDPSSLRSGPKDKPYTRDQYTLILNVLQDLRARYDGSEITDMFDAYIHRVLYTRK